MPVASRDRPRSCSRPDATATPNRLYAASRPPAASTTSCSSVKVASASTSSSSNALPERVFATRIPSALSNVLTSQFHSSEPQSSGTQRPGPQPILLCHCHARSGTISEVTDAFAEHAAGLSARRRLHAAAAPIQRARGSREGARAAPTTHQLADFERLGTTFRPGMRRCLASSTSASNPRAAASSLRSKRTTIANIPRPYRPAPVPRPFARPSHASPLRVRPACLRM